MANKNSRKNNGNPLARAMSAKEAPIYETAARWSDALSAGSFEQVDAMTRLPAGSGSIGGGNSTLQSLTQSGPIRRDKIMAYPDGTAVVLFKRGRDIVGCAYLQVSGHFVTDAKIASF